MRAAYSQLCDTLPYAQPPGGLGYRHGIHRQNAQRHMEPHLRHTPRPEAVELPVALEPAEHALRAAVRCSVGDSIADILPTSALTSAVTDSN